MGVQMDILERDVTGCVRKTVTLSVTRKLVLVQMDAKSDISVIIVSNRAQ